LCGDASLKWLMRNFSKKEEIQEDKEMLRKPLKKNP
jgi:hypothetical protein